MEFVLLLQNGSSKVWCLPPITIGGRPKHFDDPFEEAEISHIGKFESFFLPTPFNYLFIDFNAVN